MSVLYKKVIISLFLCFSLLTVIISVTTILIYKNYAIVSISSFKIGNLFGKIALGTYVLTLIPGIATRLTINNSVVRYLRIFRRYLGILMYSLAFNHLMLVKVQFAANLTELLPSNRHETYGALAFCLLFFLFITSNDYSVRLLKKAWIQIHKLTYLAMFFVFLHVSILERGLTSYLMGFVVLLQIASFIAEYLRNKKQASKVQNIG